jgi:hypothetical protein
MTTSPRTKLRKMKHTRAKSIWGVVLGAASVLLLLAPEAAKAQWKWRDANGVMQYTDRPPPSSTPDSQILSRPAASRAAPSTPPSAAPLAQEPKTTPTGKPEDRELEAKRRQLEEKKAAERKAEEAQQAKARSENCERARAYQRSLQSGQRITRTNERGEREVLDDGGRDEEMQRTSEAIDSNCR